MKNLFLGGLILLSIGCGRITSEEGTGAAHLVTPSVAALPLPELAVSPSVVAILEGFTRTFTAARAGVTQIEDLRFTLEEWTALYDSLFALGIFSIASHSILPGGGLAAWAEVPHTPLFDSVTLTVTVSAAFQVSYSLDIQPGSLYRVTSAVALINGVPAILVVP